MSPLSLVCPFDENLLSDMSNQTLVVNIDDPAGIASVHNQVSASENRLEAVRVWWNRPIGDLEPRSEWQDIPFIVYASCLGEFRKFFSNRQIFRKLKARFFLCSDSPQSVQELKLLASLQFSCGIYFGEAAPDWDALNDLMHYAYYSRGAHSAVEPFDYLARNYSNTARMTIDPVYYDDPAQYLHVDREQNIALTALKLHHQDFIGRGVDSLGEMVQSDVYRSHATAWQRHMLDRDPCSFCPSMRVCGGRFAPWLDHGNGCRQFFLDLMDGIEFARATPGAAVAKG